MKIKINILLFLRAVIAGVFILSGAEKLISPYQNFLYVVQGYELFNGIFDQAIAFIMPWIELILGVFVLFGLWLKTSLRLTLVLIVGFIIIVSQAILRGLPIEECGCFGDLLSLPLNYIIIFDSALFVITSLLLLFFKKSSVFSLDNYFSSTK